MGAPTKDDIKLHKQRTAFQRGYAEGVDLNLRAPTGTKKALTTVLKAIQTNKTEKKGIDKGQQDAFKALEYQNAGTNLRNSMDTVVKGSMDKTTQVRKDNEKRKETLKRK